MGVLGLESPAPGLKIQPAQVLEGILDLSRAESRFLLDERQTVMLQIVEVLGDQNLQARRGRESRG